jgi:pilus assembly protein CpaB
MDKRIINLLVGVGFAIIAILLIHKQMTQNEARIQELIRQGQIVEVVVAKTDIARETTITADMAELKRVAAKSLQPNDLTSLDSVIGKFAVADILKGQHFNNEMVKPLLAIRFLSERVPQGFRAVTIAVDKLSAIEGLIKPDDKVDIVGTFTFPSGGPPVVITLFQGVKILATNKNISPYRADGKSDTVTIAVKNDDVKTLAYALEIAKIRLALRAAVDTSEDYEYAALTLDGLMNKLNMVQRPIEQPKPPTVDVYKGSREEEVTINR